MALSDYKDGDYISLYFEDDPKWRVIKGWHDMKHCQSELNKEYGEDAGAVSKIEHSYGFWAVGRDECGEPQKHFMRRDESGRGRFKVTIAYVGEGDDQ